MAFTVINSSEIAAGEPTKQELFGKIKDNFDDHESRIGDTEAFTTATVPFIFEVVGQGRVVNGTTYIRVPFSITLTGIKLFVFKAGTSGTLTVDVQRKVGVGAFATVLSSAVSSAYTDGDLFVQADSGLAITSIPAGAFLRLDISSIQIGAEGFQVIVEYEVNI